MSVPFDLSRNTEPLNIVIVDKLNAFKAVPKIYIWAVLSQAASMAFKISFNYAINSSRNEFR